MCVIGDGTTRCTTTIAFLQMLIRNGQLMRSRRWGVQSLAGRETGQHSTGNDVPMKRPITALKPALFFHVAPTPSRTFYSSALGLARVVQVSTEMMRRCFPESRFTEQPQNILHFSFLRRLPVVVNNKDR